MASFRRPNALTILGLALCIVGIGSSAMSRHTARQAVVEAAAIYAALALRPSSRVADVGAGAGRYALELARTLNVEGYVCATELDLGLLATIRAAAAGLNNVTALESRQTDTGLPPACCDGIFLRRVYYHLTDPAAIRRASRDHRLPI